MLEVVHTVTHSKNFWRNIKMSELGELYISITLKTFAFSMIGVFVPIYLYQLGFSLQMVALYYAMYFAMRAPFNFLSGTLVARYGPKHVMSYAYVLTLVYLGMLMTMEPYSWPLWALSLGASSSVSFYFIGYHVDFSRIKSTRGVGTEMSHMYMLQKIAAAIGPLLGGLMALVFGIHFVIGVSIVFVLLAIWPLMLTHEPIRKRATVNYRSFSLLREKRNMIAYGSVGIGRQMTLTLWPLYIAVFIFTENIYGMVGLVTSVSVVASIIMAKMIGGVIDNNKGGVLLRYSVAFLTVVNALRISVSSLAGVIGVNIASEFSETGVLLPLMKGFYARADGSKDRIAYVVIMETSVVLFRAVLWLGVAFLLVTLEQQLAMKLVFIFAALVTPLTLVENYQALRVVK